jgi:hypothetical protein
MKCRIEGFSRFEDAEGDVEELAHHRADDELWRLAGGGEAFAEAPAPGGLVQRHHGGHVERLAQEGVADLGQARLGLHAGAGVVQARAQAGEGGDLAGVAEMGGVCAV